MIAIVCPSNRPASLARWRREWAGEFDRPDVRVYEVLDEPATWAAISADLGWQQDWIIPARSDCIRSYGFLQAWRDGAQTIITLDDDCYPETPDFIANHVNHLSLTRTVRWTSTIKGLRPRGFPSNVWPLRRVVLNMGLWAGVPDLDGDAQLANPGPWVYEGVPQIVPIGTYFPMSGMNLAFDRDLVPAMYFGLQGGMVRGNGSWCCDRFGDIWCGLFAKKICDHLGYAVRTGGPWVRHERASDPVRNQRLEQPGKRDNEWLWQRVDEVRLTESTVAGCYYELGAKLQTPDEWYWRNLKRAMLTWAELFT